MAAKERAIHLDCKVFTECHRDEPLCGAASSYVSWDPVGDMVLVTNPSKVTCHRCRYTARKMIRRLEKFPVLREDK